MKNFKYSGVEIIGTRNKKEFIQRFRKSQTETNLQWIDKEFNN